MDNRDVVIYQVLAGVLALAVGFLGAKFGGHYLHESTAHGIQFGDRPKSSESDHTAALDISHGFKDTQAFDAMKLNLNGTEIAAATLEVHPLEKYSIFVGLGAGLLGYFLSHEAARISARKKAAKNSIRGATQRFQNPRG